MPKRVSLGRGLGSLIPPKINKNLKSGLDSSDQYFESGERVLNISINKISSNPKQPRQYFNALDMKELVDSIREHGIIQPLIVSRISENSYELIAGERRLRAAKTLKFKTVPAILKKVKDHEKLELALIENIQRKDLNPVEEALAYQKLIDEFNLTQEKIAKRVGKSRPVVANALRLLNLPEEIQKVIVEGKITSGHARSILALNTPREQLNLMKKILESGLSVREAERGVKRINIKKGKIKKKKTPVLFSKEEFLRNHLGTKVEIKKRGNKGQIIIHFYSGEELNGILKKILKSR